MCQWSSSICNAFSPTGSLKLSIPHGLRASCPCYHCLESCRVLTSNCIFHEGKTQRNIHHTGSAISGTLPDLRLPLELLAFWRQNDLGSSMFSLWTMNCIRNLPAARFPAAPGMPMWPADGHEIHHLCAVSMIAIWAVESWVKMAESISLRRFLVVLYGCHCYSLCNCNSGKPLLDLKIQLWLSPLTIWSQRL